MAADALVILEPAAERGAPARTPHPVATPDLSPLFAPRSVAVVGASDDVSKWGGSLLRNLIDGDFAGPVYPVNGRGGTVQGLSAYSAIAAPAFPVSVVSVSVTDPPITRIPPPKLDELPASVELEIDSEA